MSRAGTETKKQNSKKVKKKKSFAAVVFSFMLIVIVTAASAVASYNFAVKSSSDKGNLDDLKVDPQNAIELEIPLGSSTADIAQVLSDKGLIKYPWMFKILSKINGYDNKYKSGTHYVSNELDYDQLMRVLSSNPATIKVTIPEGLNFKQLTELLHKQKVIKDVKKFAQVANTAKFDFKFVEGIPKRDNRLEGYLFPDTYYFNLKTGENEVLNKMLNNFSNKFKPEYYEKLKELNKKYDKLDMTVDKIIILASIIERETKRPEEMRTVASVFYNRLVNKDVTLKKLQSCATIQYIFINKDGTVKEKISETDTKINHAYNTYQHEGLTPGPICSPGQLAIEAALNPEKTDYLYFVAKGDGSHHFSKTLKEHTAAMKKYGVN